MITPLRSADTLTLRLTPPTETEFLIVRLGILKQLAISLEAQSRYSPESLKNFEIVVIELGTILERLQILQRPPT